MGKINAGADWLIRQRYADSETISELGMLVAGLLNEWYRGIYHAPDWKHLKAAQWSNPDWIDVRHYGTLSSVDYDDLTRLVFLAHDFGLRIELSAVGGRPKLLNLAFSNRNRLDHPYRMHPTLEGAVQKWRKASDSESEG